MKRMRTLLALILALLMTAVSACALAELGSGTCGEGLTWHLDDEGTLTISGSGEMPDYQTSSDTAPWYALRTSVLSVVLKEGVTSIGDYAFYECISLTAVTIPASVTSIGYDAFSGCSSLTSVTIPEGVTSIGYSVFEDCTSLTAVTIPASVTSIGGSAFSGCSSLEAVTIPAGVTSIGRYAFDGCTSLTEVTIPAGVTSIESGVFDDCSSLTAVTIPAGVTSIGYSAFNNCTSLTAVTIPAGVTSIGSYAFKNCSSLTEVTIPAGVTRIDYSVFQDCTSLMAVTIPAGVTSIEDDAFSGCSSLTAVTIPAGVTSIGSSAFSGCSSLTAVTIPAGVTSIENSAFYGCTSLTEVTIPDSVRSIGSSAFSGCTQAEITLPDRVTSIGSKAFDGVRRIFCNPRTTTTASLYRASTDYHYCAPGAPDFLLYDHGDQTVLAKYEGEGGEVAIPQCVTSIGDSVFRNCTSLTAVTIPAGVTSIEYAAFFGCRSLPAVTIPAGVTSIGGYAFYRCSSLEAVTIPAGVTSIGDSAFSGCTQAEITLPDSVTSIGSKAFDGVRRIFCNPQTTTTALLYRASYRHCVPGAPDFLLYDKAGQTILAAYTGEGGEAAIPQGVTSISDSVFKDCTSLTEVTIPASVTSIWDDAFSRCSSLEAVTIPAGVKSIGSSAFYGCSSLMAVTIPAGVTSIGNYAFSGCSSLEAVTILAGVTSIGGYAFNNCTSLTEVTIPAGVTSISDSVFRNCSSLEVVTIPASVTSIGNYAFSGCTQAEITLPDGITSIGSSSFNGVRRIFCNPRTTTSVALGVAFFPPDALDFKLHESGDVVYVDSYNGSKANVLVPSHAMRWSTSTAFASLRLPSTLDADCSFTFTAADVTVPDGVTSLGTLALKNVQRLYLPDSVQSFDGLTITGTKPVVYCSAGSTAQAWAMFNGYETCMDDWESVCTLRYLNALALDVGESIALRRTDFVISPIPVGYRGEMTLESADLAVDGMTITALTPGDETVTATLDGWYTTSVPVHVYQPVERIALKAPSIAQAGQTFTVTVEELAPEDVSGRLIWIQDGKQAYEGTGTSLTLTAPEGQSSTVIRVTAPGGAYSEVTVRVPMTISTPYLRSGTVELGSLVGICVDVDGETLADDPQTYGTVELGSAAAGLTLEDGVVRATGLGTVTFRVKGLSGSWAYLTVTVQDTQHAYRTQVPAVEPTWAEPGNTAYEICRGCGRFFNAEGKEIEEGSWVLPVTHVHHLAGGSACRDCGQTFSTTGLNVMTLPTALRVIRDEAFAGATAQTIVVPMGCEAIGERAFARCAALRSIFLPAALEESLPESAFEGCDPEMDIIFR